MLLLNELFFTKVPKLSRKYKLLENPRSKKEMLKILQNSYSYSKNPVITIVENHYNDYLKKFLEFHESKTKVSKGMCNLPQQIFSFWETHNTRINFYICRGYTEEESLHLRGIRQSTMNNNTQEKVEKRKKTMELKSPEEQNRINNAKGNCNRWEWYLDKINSITGEVFTELEAREKVRLKQQKATLGLWKKVKNGEIEYYTNCNVNFYIKYKGLNYDEAVQELTKRQETFSLEVCIEKYGKEEGIKRWERRQKKWQETMDTKSDEEKKRINIAKTRKLPRFSKSSADLFDLVLGDGLFTNYDVYYKDKEYFVYDNEKKRIFYYDFVIPELKVCIEYQGITYHPHPNLTENEKQKWIEPYSKLNYWECQKFDNYKNNLIITKGYDLLIVWETDKNKFETIRTFLKTKKDEYERITN